MGLKRLAYSASSHWRHHPGEDSRNGQSGSCTFTAKGKAPVRRTNRLQATPGSRRCFKTEVKGPACMSRTLGGSAMRPWLRLTLVTMTVGGGFTGVAISFQLLLSPQVRQPASFVLTSVSLALFAFVTFSGLLFVHNAQRTRPMVVAMALQVPRFSSPLVAYKLSAGFQLVVALMGGRFNTSFSLGSDFQLNLLQQLPWGAGVNLFALLMLWACGLTNGEDISENCQT